MNVVYFFAIYYDNVTIITSLLYSKLVYHNYKWSRDCTEVKFASFLSGLDSLKPPDRKLANSTSVHC